MEEDDAPGVPEWVVTYGDMMSLLLTFFIMLVSLSEVKADEKYRAILDALQQYTGYRGGPIAPPGTSFPLNGMIDKFTIQKLGSQTDDDKGFGGVRKKSVEGTDARVFRTREGKAMRVGDPIPFAPNEAIIDKKYETELAAIAQQLAGKPNKIEIRGHTSSAPLPKDSVWKNKTELSYHRARQVYEALAALNVNTERLRLGAAADREPLSANDRESSQQADRVEVLILDAFANDFVGPRSAE